MAFSRWQIFTNKPKSLGNLYLMFVMVLLLYTQSLNLKFLSEKVMLCEIHSQWMLCSLIFLLHLDNKRCSGFCSIVLDLDSIGNPTIFVKIFLYFMIMLLISHQIIIIFALNLFRSASDLTIIFFFLKRVYGFFLGWWNFADDGNKNCIIAF